MRAPYSHLPPPLVYTPPLRSADGDTKGVRSSPPLFTHAPKGGCTRITKGRGRIWRECAGGEGGACEHRICNVALTILFQAVDEGHAGEWGAARLEGEGREREEGGRGVEMNRGSPATPSRLARDLRVFLL